MYVPITMITTGILGLLFLWHASRIIKVRASLKLGLGDGGEESMVRKIRTHANFAEYTPLLLVMLLLLEIANLPAALLWGFAALIIGGRMVHAYGMLPVGGIMWARTAGMVATLTALGLGSVGLILRGLGIV